jgi:hypothetical protein
MTIKQLLEAEGAPPPTQLVTDMIIDMLNDLPAIVQEDVVRQMLQRIPALSHHAEVRLLGELETLAVAVGELTEAVEDLAEDKGLKGDQ